MSRVFVGGSSARLLRRMARTGRGLHLEPTNLVRPEAPRPVEGSYVSLGSLGMSGICSVLGADAVHPLELLVPTQAKRVRARGVRCRVCSAEFPAGSFQRVVQEDGTLWNPGIELLVESPQLSFLMTTRQTRQLVSKGVLDDQRAELSLLRLAVEECGSYALDPWRPRDGDFCRGLLPQLSANDLRAYLEEAHGLRGAKRALKTADLVFDGADSPMEAFVNAALALPVHLGGLGLARPVANHAIDVKDKQELGLVHVSRITPDLLWPKPLMIIIEYLGKEPHEGQEAQDEDMGRIQDFQALGYLVFPLRYRHVRTPREFNRMALRLATAMDERGAKGTRAWVEELMEDEEFLARQRVLFATMLPVVRDR